LAFYDPRKLLPYAKRFRFEAVTIKVTVTNGNIINTVEIKIPSEIPPGRITSMVAVVNIFNLMGIFISTFVLMVVICRLKFDANFKEVINKDRYLNIVLYK